MPYKTLKFSVQVSMFSLMFCFFSLFDPKRNYTSPISSESAKDLVGISVLEEKLELWWKLQFAKYVAKVFSTSLNVFVNVCFFSIFGTKRQLTSPSSCDSAKELVKISVLEEKLDLWWKLQFGSQDAKI